MFQKLVSWARSRRDIYFKFDHPLAGIFGIMNAILSRRGTVDGMNVHTETLRGKDCLETVD